MALADTQWIDIQQDTFTNWCNNRLKNTDTRINNLITDLDDGLRLIVLLEQLSRRPFPRKYHKKPHGPFQRLENLERALDFIQHDEGIYMVNIGALDLTDHKRDLILGLIWHLILHYQIFGLTKQSKPATPTSHTRSPTPKLPPRSAGKILLNWVRAAMPSDVKVRNLTSDWNGGEKLSALVETMKPGLCPNYASLSPSDALPNTKKAMDQAEEEFDIPQIIDPEHLCIDKPDELSCMTYLSYFCSGEDSPGYNNLLEWVRSKIPEYNIENFTDDWRDGRALSALVNAVSEGAVPNHAQLDPNNGVDNIRSAMKTADENLEGIENNITPEEFADKRTDALAMMGYIEWYRKATPKKRETLSAVGPVEVVEKEPEIAHEKEPEEIRHEKETEQDTEEVKKSADSVQDIVTEEDLPEQHSLEVGWDWMDGSREKLDEPDEVEVEESTPPTVAIGTSTVLANTPTDFTVDCHRAGPGSLSVDIKSPSGADVPTTVTGENVYNVQYTPTEVGPHNIVVLYSDHQVRGSPFTAIVYDPSKVVVSGDGLSGGITGEKAEFTVNTEEAGPGKPIVKVTGPNRGVRCTEEEVDEHKYKYCYTPQEAGPHSISVVFADEEIPGSPFPAQVEVPDYTDQIILKDIPKGKLYATRLYSVTMDTRSAGNSEVRGTMENGSSSSLCPVLESVRNVYSIRFTPVERGQLTLRLYYGSREIPSSPLIFTVVDIRDIKLTPPTPGPLGVFIVNQPYSYTLVTCDTSDSVSLKAKGTRSGTEINADISYLGSAEYKATVSCREVDAYDILVYYGEEPVHHARHRLNVVDKPHPERVVCHPPSTEGTAVNIHADVSKSGPGALTAVAMGDSVGQVPVKVMPKSRYTYNIVMTTSSPDLYMVKVLWNSVDVPDSPFIVDTRPHPNQVVVNGDGLSGGITGEKAEFTVNTEEAGPGKPIVKVTGPNRGVRCTEEEVDEHKYKYCYTPQEAGPHSISVVFADEEIPGSPFTAQVDEAIPVDANKVKVDGPHSPQMHRAPVYAVCDVSQAGDGELTSTCRSRKYGNVPVDVSPENEGVQRVSFNPPGKDVYYLSMLWSGDPVPGSPYTIDLNPPLASEVRVDGPHPSPNGIGPVHASIDTTNAGEGVLDVKTSGERLGAVPSKVMEKDPGQYSVEFDAHQPDIYHMDVKWSGEHVPGSTFRIPVDLGEDLCQQEVLEDVESSYIPATFAGIYDDGESKEYTTPEYPESIPSFHVGEKLSITTDKEGDEDPGRVTASCRGDTVGDIPVSMVKNPDGTYTASIDPRVPDLYTVDVLMNSQHVPGSPFKVRYLPPPTDATKCRVYNTPPPDMRLIAHEDIMYNVDASKAGAGELSVQSEGPSGAKTNTNLQVIPKEDQDFKIIYTPTKAGVHKHYIYWGKEAIPESPVEFDVSPRDIPVYPWAKSIGLDYEFPGLRPKDLSGHVIYQPSGKKMKLSVEKNKSEPEKTHVSFKPADAGIYEIHILHHKNHVRGSPFEVRVLEPPRPDKVKVSGLEDAKCYVGDSVPFRVDCSEAGTGELLVKSNCPSKDDEPSQLDVVDNKDNTYESTYIPSSVGNHLLHMKWADQPVPGSPFTVQAVAIEEPKMDAGLTIVEVGQPVDIQLADKPSDEVVAYAMGDNTGTAHVSVQKEDDGNHRVIFEPLLADDYTVNVLLNGSHIDGSPFRVKALDKTTIFADGEEGVPTTITEVEVNTNVNFVLRPGPIEGDPEVRVIGPSGPIETDTVSTEEGRYITHFKPDEEGDYYCNAKHNNAHLKGSPFRVLAIDKMKSDPSKCFILPEDVEVMSTPYEHNQQVDFRVSTLNAGPGTLNVTSRGPAKADVIITDNKDGIYSVRFNPSEPGKYKLDVTWDEVNIRGSPCTVIIKGERKSRVLTGLDLSNVPFRVGKPYKFKIHCDELGEGAFDVQVAPATDASITIRDLGNHTYHVTLVPKEPGEHKVSVLHSNQHILGSPFSCQFQQLGDASKCRLLEDAEEQQHEVGEKVSFLVTTEGAGPGTLTASVENVHKKTTGPAEVNQLDETTYRVTFDPGQEEEYSLNVKYDGIHIIGSPCTLMLEQ
jgi:filamin